MKLSFLRYYVCLSGPEQGKDKMVNIIKKKDLDRKRL